MQNHGLVAAVLPDWCACINTQGRRWAARKREEAKDAGAQEGPALPAAPFQGFDVRPKCRCRRRECSSSGQREGSRNPPKKIRDLPRFRFQHKRMHAVVEARTAGPNNRPTSPPSRAPPPSFHLLSVFFSLSQSFPPSVCLSLRSLSTGLT